MLIDGIQLVEGTNLTNLTVNSGASFPLGPDHPPSLGELFYKTDNVDTLGVKGLYTFDGTIWTKNVVGSDTTQTINVINSTSILPTATSTYDIGSPSLRWKTIYVDEARLSTNTLYIGDTAILGTSAQTVNIHADPNQSIDIQTSGTGSSTMQSAKGVNVTTTGTNANVIINATGASSNVQISATNEVQISGTGVAITSPLTVASQTVSGNLTVTGNLIVNGSQTQVNSAVLQVTDNIITLNKGEIGSGVTAGASGLQVDRGDVVDYQILFDETDDLFKVGMIGDLEIIASRPWVNTNYSGATHSHTVDSLSNVTVANKVAGQALTWDGATWKNQAVDAFASGTSLMFTQATAPAGWTQDVSDNANNRMLRVVNDNSGGLIDGTHSPILMNVVPAHTHTITTGTESADHTHTGYTGTISANHTHTEIAPAYGGGGNMTGYISGSLNSTINSQQTGTVSANHTHTVQTYGRSAAHSHSGTTNNGSSQTDWTPRYINMINCIKD